MGDVVNFRARDENEKAEVVVYSVEELTIEVMLCEHEVAEFIAEKIKERGNLVPLLGMLNYLETLPFPKDQIYDIILSRHIQNAVEGTGNINDKPKT